jgi:hypothetical protein
MLSALGLALNVVGAAVLSIGLFRPSRALFAGWARNPLTAATDYAFGATGFGFLAAGFLLQALPHFGVQATNCVGASELAAAVGLIAGGMLAWVLCEVLRAFFFVGEKAYAAKSYQPFKSSLVFEPGLERGGRWPTPRLWQLRSDQED